jgi:hypothetical protein
MDEGDLSRFRMRGMAVPGLIETVARSSLT